MFRFCLSNVAGPLIFKILGADLSIGLGRVEETQAKTDSTRLELDTQVRPLCDCVGPNPGSVRLAHVSGLQLDQALDAETPCPKTVCHLQQSSMKRPSWIDAQWKRTGSVVVYEPTSACHLGAQRDLKKVSQRCPYLPNDQGSKLES